MTNDTFVMNSTGYISNDWHGLPSKLDAAVFIDNLNKAFIFRGDQYWRVNLTERTTDYGYPKLIHDFLNGVEQGR